MSYVDSEAFMRQIELEMQAQGITEDQVLTAFKEDFPQAHFLVFEHEKHVRKLTKTEEGLISMVWLAYLTGYVRRPI